MNGRELIEVGPGEVAIVFGESDMRLLPASEHTPESFARTLLAKGVIEALHKSVALTETLIAIGRDAT